MPLYHSHTLLSYKGKTIVFVYRRHLLYQEESVRPEHYAPVKVNPDRPCESWSIPWILIDPMNPGGPRESWGTPRSSQVTLMIKILSVFRLTKHGTLSTTILYDTILILNRRNIDILGGDFDSESSWKDGDSDR